MRCHLRGIAVALVGVVLSLVCQIGGFVAPGWVYYDDRDTGSEFDTYVIHTGLWYRIFCQSINPCHTNPTPDNDVNEVFLELEIEVTIALVACILAAIFLIIHLARRRKNLSGEFATFLVLSIVCLITSGVLAMRAAGEHGHKIRKTQDALINVVYKFPYALFLTGLGGVLAAIIGLLLVLVVHHLAVANKYMEKGEPTTHM